MKIVFIWGFVLSLLVGSGVFLSKKIQRTQQKKEVYSSLPEFQLPDIEGRIVTRESVMGHHNVLFLYFNPDCDLCRDELTEISLNQLDLETGLMVFFSVLPSDSINRFLEDIDFIQASNMLFLSDEKEILCSQLEVKMSPTVYMYRKGKLFRRFDGPVKIETLIDFFSEKQ